MAYYKKKDRGRGDVRRATRRVEKSAEIASEAVPEQKVEPTAERKADDLIMSSAKENSHLGFKQAFASARANLGAGKTFVWRGKHYTTDYREESAAPSMEEVAAGEASILPTTAKKQMESDTHARMFNLGPR